MLFKNKRNLIQAPKGKDGFLRDWLAKEVCSWNGPVWWMDLEHKASDLVNLLFAEATVAGRPEKPEITVILPVIPEDLVKPLGEKACVVLWYPNLLEKNGFNKWLNSLRADTTLIAVLPLAEFPSDLGDLVDITSSTPCLISSP